MGSAVYDSNAIQTLSFRQAIRERVAMYMGSADNQGVLQCIREIITNSIDEATMGFGDTITVIIDSRDNRVIVKDNGRGVPFGIREDGIEVMEAIYTMPHTGGKFNNKVYQNVAGMNGIGAKGTALSSDYFKVSSFRDGKCATLELKDGIKTSFSVKDLLPHDTSQGTAVVFIPSQEVYNLEPIHIDFNEIVEMCKNWSYLMKGITFIVQDFNEGTEYRFCKKNGIIDMLNDNNKKSLNKTPLYNFLSEDGIEAEVAMEWTNSRQEEYHVFTNGIENIEGGTSLTGVKTALTNFFKKKIKKGDNPDLFRKGLYYVVSCKVPNPSFSNQTKTRVNTPQLRGLCQRATTRMLEDFEKRHNDEFLKIVDLLEKELKADIAAEKAREQILEATKNIEQNQKKKVFASDKLKDAEFLGEDSTLLLVEGLSAASSIAMARDSKKYGILALRGKMINTFANDDEKIYQNEEVKLLLSAMNIIPGKYDSKKLRYGRIGICSDADADGFSIGLLIMCAIYKFAPEFVEEGRLCWLRSPLYIVKNKNKEEYYFTDEEFNLVKDSIKGEVQRNKGLGSLSAEQAHNSMFTEEFQRIDTLLPDENSLPTLLDLMGKDSKPKRDFIFNNIDFSEIKE